VKKQYALVVDLDKCFGCKGCSVSCHNEHDMPPGVNFCKVDMEGPTGVFPDLEMSFFPRNCMHCSNPSCVEVCPADAININDDGLVIIDADLCSGCGECIEACPYGVCYYNDEKQIAQKCDMCLHLVKNGDEPNCVASCPGLARFFGDINDPKSEAARMLKENKEIVFRDREDLNTNPNVYYLPVRKIK